MSIVLGWYVFPDGSRTRAKYTYHEVQFIRALMGRQCFIIDVAATLSANR